LLSCAIAASKGPGVVKKKYFSTDPAAATLGGDDVVIYDLSCQDPEQQQQLLLDWIHEFAQEGVVDPVQASELVAAMKG
jgi:hypothetical protein